MLPPGSEAKAKPPGSAGASRCRPPPLPGRSGTGAGGDPRGAAGWDTRSGSEKKARHNPAAPASSSRRLGATGGAPIPEARPGCCGARQGGSGRLVPGWSSRREEKEEEEKEEGGSGFPTPRLHLPPPLGAELLLAFLPAGEVGLLAQAARPPPEGRRRLRNLEARPRGGKFPRAPGGWRRIRGSALWGGGVRVSMCPCGNSSPESTAPCHETRHDRCLLVRKTDCKALNVFIMRGINSGRPVRPFGGWEGLASFAQVLRCPRHTLGNCPFCPWV